MTIQTIPVRRPALVAGLAALLAFAPFAAAGDKPGTGKAAPAKPAGTSAAKPAASLDEIALSFARQEHDARLPLRRARYEAILAYVKANGAAKDAEEARKALVDLAEELEDWAKVVQHADELLAAHADSKSKLDVTLSKAGALANLGKYPDAKALYEPLAKDAKPDDAGINVSLQYASALADSGDLAAARAAYVALRELTPNEALRAYADAQVLGIEAIGGDPTAFPDDTKDLDGKPVSLKEYAGKVVLIDFWASRCGPCRGEIPHVVSAYEKWHDKGFEVVGISRDEPNDADGVRSFTAEHRMAWRQVLDTAHENALAKAYDVGGIPHTVLVSKDGKIARVDVRGASLERALARLFSGAPVTKLAPAVKPDPTDKPTK